MTRCVEMRIADATEGTTKAIMGDVAVTIMDTGLNVAPL